jgi:hypothetical protein
VAAVEAAHPGVHIYTQSSIASSTPQKLHPPGSR